MEQTFDNGVYYSPGKKVLLSFTLNKIALAVILFAVIGYGISFLHINMALSVVVVVGIIVCAIIFLREWMKYKSVTFMLDEVSFHVRKGLFSKSEIAIPYTQVQNVNYEQSFNEKMWGIANITIQTAGTDESGNGAKSDGVLPVLDANLASALEKQLLQKTSAK